MSMEISNFSSGARTAAVCQVCYNAIFPSVFLLSLRNLAARLRLRLHTPFFSQGSHTADEHSTCGLSKLYTLAPVCRCLSKRIFPSRTPFQGSAEERGMGTLSVADGINPVNIINAFKPAVCGVCARGSQAMFVRANIKIYFSYHYLFIYYCHLIFIGVIN